jgi:hypothetical protein
MRRKGVVLFPRGEKSPSSTHRTGLFRPTTAFLPAPPVGVPASPWIWAKARCKLSALNRLCGDGAVSNEAKGGHSIYTGKITPPAHRTGLFRPTTAFLPTSPVGVPASPWMWAKARSKPGALNRLCGDGAVSNEAKGGRSIYTEKITLASTQNRAVPTHHRISPDAPRWRFRLALDVGCRIVGGCLIWI